MFCILKRICLTQRFSFFNAFREKSLPYVSPRCQNKRLIFSYSTLSKLSLISDSNVSSSQNVFFLPNNLKNSASKSSFNFHQSSLFTRSRARYFSTENENEPPSFSQTPMLMKFPLIVWPSVVQTLRNWIFVFFIIRPYYENDFSLRAFTSAARKVFVKLSEIVSKGDFEELGKFVDESALEEVKNNYSLFNVKERSDLAATIDDVFFCFPYQIGVIFKKDGGPTERVFLEITMCFHVFRGFKDFIEKADDPDLTAVYDNTDRISIANYRFIKEVTKGSEDQWTVNVLNHFKPIKLAARY